MITELGNGYVKITYPNGVKDKRNGMVNSEAIVKEEDKDWFVEA